MSSLYVLEIELDLVFLVCQWRRWPILICPACWKVTRFRKHFDHHGKHCLQARFEI